MFEQTPILTNVGQSMLIRGITGERICFTRFKAGSGKTDGSDPADLDDLRAPEVIFPISSIARGNSNEYMTISGKFDNEMLDGNDLYWREIGLFCAIERETRFVQQGNENTYQLTTTKPYPYDVVSVSVQSAQLGKDSWVYNRNTGMLTIREASKPQVGHTITVVHPDVHDYLYSYCYDAKNTGLILSAVSSTRLTQTVEMVITIKGAEIDVLYVGDGTDTSPIKNALNDHINDHNNPHQVTKAQVGLGLVPNVATDDQTPGHANIGDDAGNIPQLSPGEKISVALAKIARVITRFIEHTKADNPHNITAEKLGCKPVIGEYVGNSSANNVNRAFDLGFTPSALIISCDSANNSAYKMLGMMINGSSNTVKRYYVTATDGGNYPAAEITDNGFRIIPITGNVRFSSNYPPNQLNVTYKYIAFK